MNNEAAFSLGVVGYACENLPIEKHAAFYEAAARAIVLNRYAGEKVAADHSAEITKIAVNLGGLGRFFSGAAKSMRGSSPRAVQSARRSALSQRHTVSGIKATGGQQKINFGAPAPLPQQHGMYDRLKGALRGGMNEYRAGSPEMLERARRAAAAKQISKVRAASAAKAQQAPAPTPADPAAGVQQNIFDPPAPAAPTGAGAGTGAGPTAPVTPPAGPKQPGFFDSHANNIKSLWNAGAGGWNRGGFGGAAEDTWKALKENPMRNAGYAGLGAYGLGTAKDTMDAMTGSDEYDYNLWDKIKMGIGMEDKPNWYDPALPFFMRGYHAN
jgi:hypothetical protein